MGGPGPEIVTDYTTSRGCILVLNETLTMKLGPLRIHCNAIAPGFFTTEINTVLVEDSEFSAFVEGRTPLQR